MTCGAGGALFMSPHRSRVYPEFGTVRWPKPETSDFGRDEGLLQERSVRMSPLQVRRERGAHSATMILPVIPGWNLQ